MDVIYLRIGLCRTAQEAAAVRKLLRGANNKKLAIGRVEALNSTTACGAGAQRARALIAVLADLISHGWKFKVKGTEIFGCDPTAPGVDSRREYVKQIQLGQREEQLRKVSVRDFVRSMEKKRLGPNGWTSIFTVMRDGVELASKLRTTPPEQFVPAAINPYMQVIEGAKERCPFTGLRLMDVWRYFRYTWAMPYNSVPGRSMLVLIRDAAAPNHPVIGIAALGSAIVQLSQRDKWIGWTSADFVRTTKEQPSNATARWILSQLDALVDSIYKVDLLKAGILSRKELRRPSEVTIARLNRQSESDWKIHRQFPGKSDHKNSVDDDKHWKQQALSPLLGRSVAEPSLSCYMCGRI